MQSVPLKILRWLSLVKKYSGLSWRENGVGHKIKRHFIWPHFKRFETNIQGNRLKFHVIRYNYIDLEFFFWGGVVMYISASLGGGSGLFWQAPFQNPPAHLTYTF